MLPTGLPAYPPPRPVERALDLLFPPGCVGCRRVGRWICAHCWPRVLWLGAGQDRTVPPTSSLDQVIAAAMFEGIAREAVHALKFEGRHAIAPLLGRLMAIQVAPTPVDMVVPVPLHVSRRRERGYDQAALLAKHVAGSLAVPSDSHLLKRVRKTEQQTRLDGPTRRENVRGAFVAQKPLQGESVLLVDDVHTTGATMEEAARALKDAGAGQVIGIVFARAR